MQGYWIRVINGSVERWTVFKGEDGVAAHMSAMAFFNGTPWHVCWL